MMEKPKRWGSSVHASLRTLIESLSEFRRYFTKEKVRCWTFSSRKGNEPYRSKENGSEKPPKKRRDDVRKSSTISASATSNLEVAPLPIEVPELSLDELEEKTGFFGSKSLIGEGKYGRVYYAVLEGGKKVAIKNLNVPPESGSNAAFMAQLSKVSRLKHKNIVELLGYSVERNLRLLTYEFATMGSLHDVLHGRKGTQCTRRGPVLDWAQRIRIAYDAAKGLEFLHEKDILHQNIRSSNILLFEGFKAKLADFNVYNQSPDKATHLHSTIVLGTFGYSAPEFAMNGFVNKNGDIYSFGVVLLELLTGRKPLDQTKPKGERSLVTWATPKLVENKVDQCVDPWLKGEYRMNEAAKFASVAALCVQYQPDFRPSAKVLVKILGQLAMLRDQPSAPAH